MGVNQSLRARSLKLRIGTGGMSSGSPATPFAVAVLVGLCSALALSLMPGFSGEKATLCGWLFGFGAIQILIAFRLFRQDPSIVWTPMPWFLLTCALYYGFGPLVYFFADQAIIDYTQAVWTVANRDIVRVTAVNAVGVAVALLVYMAICKGKVLPGDSRRWLDSNFMAHGVKTFLLIGLPPLLLIRLAGFGYLHISPYGFLTWLGCFETAGYVLLATLAFLHGGRWWLGLGFMVAFEVGCGLLVFSKAAILQSVFPLVFGFLNQKQRGLRNPLPLCLLAMVYLGASYYVDFARRQQLTNYLVRERASVVSSFGEAKDKLDVDDSRFAWWGRINYANTQTFVIQNYDQGYPGNSMRLGLIAWVPRVVWPNKPIIESGVDLHERMTGNRGPSFGVGFFCEAYWNGGWTFVILVGGGLGWLFATFGAEIIKGVRNGNLWILPLALLWIRSGLRSDGWLHTEIIGPAVFTLLYLTLLRFWQLGPASPRRRSIAPTTK